MIANRVNWPHRTKKESTRFWPMEKGRGAAYHEMAFLGEMVSRLAFDMAPPMSTKYLGETFDIHGGGKWTLFPQS